MTTHDHPPDGDCLASCPGWAEGALELYAVQRRHDAKLAACRAAERIEFVIVAPATPGAELPEGLHGQELVRLNLVVGRDCPEVLLDEWGVRVTLTFRGRRHDCALPWAAVVAGVLVAPARKRPRFGVVTGGGEGSVEGGARPARLGAAPTPAPDPGRPERPVPVPAPAARPAPTSVPPPAARPAPTSVPAPAPRPAPASVPAPEPAPADGASTPAAPAGPPAAPARPRVPFGVIRGGKDDGDPR